MWKICSSGTAITGKTDTFIITFITGTDTATAPAIATAPVIATAATFLNAIKICTKHT